MSKFDQDWRRCAYCGKFMSYSDFEKGLIEENAMQISFEGNEIDPWYGHKKCSETAFIKENIND